MKILILRSIKTKRIADKYSLRMDTAYADRFLGHFTDKAGYCASCDKACVHCRDNYSLDFSSQITGIIDFPSVLPVIIEDPAEYIKADVPQHDIILSISVNEEILLEFIKIHSNAKGIIVPIENPDWISKHGIKTIKQYCREKNIECSFPKPFCSFNPTDGILFEFKKKFSIGIPELEFNIENNIIQSVKVLCSAPCGATYFTARKLHGINIKEDNPGFIMDMALSAYPCTASTKIDSDFNDSIIHQAVKIQKKNLLKNL